MRLSNMATGAPGCQKGKVYEQQEPRQLVRIVGQAPLTATIYALQTLRCNLCGESYSADVPEGVREDKYEESAAAMVAQLKYGSGMPFYRQQDLENNLGMPLPASTQWEIVEEAGELIKPARDELIRQAAQGEVLHNDDTSMKVLSLRRAILEEAGERTGIFTSGVVATTEGRRIALFFTGRQHAGENLADVLKRRAAELPMPIQMSDALARNAPTAIKLLVGNCLAHGRRNFVKITPNFPEPCRDVLAALGEVYHYDQLARERGLSRVERLRFHQEHSKPVMDDLHQWLETQLRENKVEPNSGLGKAISYMLRHWHALTLFLREPGAPLDNNLVTAARGSDQIMPTPGLCRAAVVRSYCLRRFSDFRGSFERHNHRLSKKASNGSGGRKRSGARPDELAWARARSLSCMSACR